MFGGVGAIMESVRSSQNDCKKKGHARNDCLKFSAWLAGCKRCMSERGTDTGELECAPTRLGGQGSATIGGEEAPRKVTASDCGLSPRLRRRNQEQGNVWQPPSTWRSNCLDRFSPLPLLTTTFESFGFDAQCMSSIIGTMVADEKNDWPPSPCCVRRSGSPSGRLYNEDGSSNGREYTCGWHQDGQRHCFTSKFHMAVTIWTIKAQRHTTWRVWNALKGHGTTRSIRGTVANQRTPVELAVEALWPACAQQDSTTLLQEQLTCSAQA